MNVERMETPGKPARLDRRICEGLSRLVVAMRMDDWRRSKTAGLNPTQLSILELLEGRPDGMSVKDLAFHLGVSQPTATDSIAALERKGLLSKGDAGSDRRAVNVRPTTDGLLTLRATGASHGLAEQAVAALAAGEQEDLLVMLVKMIRHLQVIEAIPVQRMCATCRYFAPFAHADAARPHHCNFVDAPFGRRDLRIDCRDHEIAGPASLAATRDAFGQGSASIPPGS